MYYWVEICPRCDGSGKERTDVRRLDGSEYHYYETCTSCGGKGYKD